MYWRGVSATYFGEGDPDIPHLMAKMVSGVDGEDDKKSWGAALHSSGYGKASLASKVCKTHDHSSMSLSIVYDLFIERNIWPLTSRTRS